MVADISLEVLFIYSTHASTTVTIESYMLLTSPQFFMQSCSYQINLAHIKSILFISNQSCSYQINLAHIKSILLISNPPFLFHVSRVILCCSAQFQTTIGHKFLDWTRGMSGTRYKVHFVIVSGVDSHAKAATGQCGMDTELIVRRGQGTRCKAY